MLLYVSLLFNPEKLIDAGGYRYKKARRPELYGDIISRPHKSEQHVVWLEDEQDKEKK